MENPALEITKDCATLSESYRKVAGVAADTVAVRTIDDAVSLTWAQLLKRSDALAGGLSKLGLKRGDSIALMLTNRPEFFVADLGAMTLGAVPFSIYQTLAPEQIQYVVSDAGARIAIIEQAFYEPFMKARADLPNLERVIVVDGEANAETIQLDTVEASGAGFDGAAAAGSVEEDDLVTLIYTSGTTGPPKGVELTHKNLFHCLHALIDIVEMPPAARIISWLPTAHIAERALNYYLGIAVGGTITTCPNPREIATYLPKVKPHFFFAVPRIWEKMKAGLEAQLASQPPEQRKAMEDAIDSARERVRLQQARKPVPAALEEKVKKADAEMFSLVRSLVGLDEALMVSVGAAPTPREVLEFFHAIGIELAEGWGMSETCAIGTIVKPGEVKIGTVGKAPPGFEIMLAEDGEILIRGGNIMRGYRNQPEKTAETIDPDGWLHTGDIGHIDDEGYVSIVDRKKELIINAAGKNMSPANIESTMKGASPLIGQICAIGDARSYNTALIVLDADYAPAWAAQHDLAGKSIAELAKEPKLIAAVQAGVDAGNERLARVEQLKKFTILPDEWLPGGDELTPTMKLKRKPIAEKYKEEIEAMY